MLDFISAHWQFILGCIVAIATAVVLIILYKKNKINEDYLSILYEYLDQIDEGDGIVPLLAQYAKKAVLAVEQMVKAGVLDKTNEGRKNMAKQIVTELAIADGFEMSENSMTAVDALIETAVYEMKHE